MIAALRELYAEATPSPWDAVISTGCVRYLGKPIEPLEHGDYVANCRGLDAADANAHLIAAMHAALPDLLRVVEAVAGSTPRIVVRGGAALECFYCNAELPGEHMEDCAWLIARKLVGAP